MPRRLVLLICLAVPFVACECGCTALKGKLVELLTPDYYPEGDPSNFEPVLEGKPEQRIAIRLTKITAGYELLTDLQFAPGDPTTLYVLEQIGNGKWYSLPDGQQGVFLEIDVVSRSEAGLLGLAFHPQFENNGRIFLNYVIEVDGQETTEIAEWRVPAGKTPREVRPEKSSVILQVAQPYPNHDGGQLAFGADGFLYVGFGDGGYRDDPEENGQNTKTVLGTIVRIDVDDTPDGKAYTIPTDNPFVGNDAFLPEIWAYGLRNPWRFDFDPQGRLIVADVGQDHWEEVDLVSGGDNLGWNLREGRHCFPPGSECAQGDLVDPVFEYGRELGKSVTGGYVYHGTRVPSLRDRYIFGDFTSGRLWAMEIPEQVGPKSARVWSLGKWPILPTTFGRDQAGELYLADFASGAVYRIDKAQ